MYGSVDILLACRMDFVRDERTIGRIVDSQVFARLCIYELGLRQRAP